MENILWGIPLVLFCAAVYLFSWRLTKDSQYTFALSCIMLCGLALRIYAGADACLHDWDERYHALVGKHLAQHWLKPTLYERPLLPYDYTAWTSNHIWLHKQPLSLWLIAVSVRLFGLHAFAVRLPAILFTTVGIKLIYDIGKEWYGRQVGILAAFLFSIHGLIIELAAGRAGTDCVDAVFLFFVLLAVLVTIRAVQNTGYALHLLLGGIVGLGILTKWLPALVTIPIWAILAFPVFKNSPGKMLACFLCIIIGASMVALPWQLYIFHTFPTEARWEHAYNSQHLFRTLEGHDGNFFYHFDQLRMKYGELVYLPVLWFTWENFKAGKPAGYALLFWFWATYLFFSFVATKMEAYTIIAAPAVFLITAIAFLRLRATIIAKARYRYLRIAVCFALVALPVRYAIERIKPFTVMDRNTDWNRQIEVLRRSPDNTNRTVIFKCAHPIEMMFLTDCIAYEQNCDSLESIALSNEGFKVLTQ